MFAPQDVVDDERTADASQCERTDLPDLHGLGNRRRDLGRDQDFAVRGGLAQPRGGIRYRADRTVIEAAGESDLPQHGDTSRDADAEPDPIPASRPSLRE